MKKPILFILLIAATITSCSSDDDSAGALEITTANLVGKWQLINSTTDGKVETLNECELKYTIEYLSNGTVNWVDPYNNAKPDEPINCIESNGTLFWELVDLTIYLKEKVEDTNEDPEKILELTKTTLKTQYTYQLNTNTFQEVVETYKRV